MSAPMYAGLFRLVAMLSLLLMPFGMPGALAPAYASHRDASVKHCQTEPEKKLDSAEGKCAISCAVIMPAAADTGLIDCPAICRASAAIAAADDLQPETATPPPRHS